MHKSKLLIIMYLQINIGQLGKRCGSAKKKTERVIRKSGIKEGNKSEYIADFVADNLGRFVPG